MKNKTITDINNAVLFELERIAAVNGGILKAEQVVESGRDPDSPLHDYFEWSDTKAAQEYRLCQARLLIRCVVVMEPITEKSIRAFVSLSPDRENAGGGYRQITVVLKSKARRDQMLADALGELLRLEEKYKSLTELAGVFSAVHKVKR
jgi:hypothetical protein